MTHPDDGADPATAAMLAERYGTVPVARARLWTRLLIVVVAVAGTAVVVWVGLGMASAPVRWTDVGYQVHGSQLTDVTFEVVMEPGTVAECRVQALSESYAQVGVRDVVVGPSQAQVVRATESISTSEEAVTAIVDSCRVLEP